MPPTVLLPQYWIDQCRRYGHERVAWYKADPRRCLRSVKGLELNPETQARTKMGEVAAALHLGLDPHTAVRWKVEIEPGDELGWDIIWQGHKIDVKTIDHYKLYLCWNCTKADRFEKSDFDLLLLIEDDCPLFTIRGWLTKQEFREMRSFAEPGHPLLPGTAYVWKGLLHPEEDLAGLVPEAGLVGAL